MKNMRRLTILILMIPLVVTGVLFSCLCPAMAAVSSTALQVSHDCCCPEMSMPQNPGDLMTANLGQRSNEDFVFNALSAETNPVSTSENNSTHDFNFPEKDTSQDLYLKNRNLRI